MSFYVVVYQGSDGAVAHVQCSDVPIDRPAIQDDSLTKFSAVVAGDYCDSKDILPLLSVDNGLVSIDGHTIESQAKVN